MASALDPIASLLACLEGPSNIHTSIKYGSFPVVFQFLIFLVHVFVAFFDSHERENILHVFKIKAEIPTL